MPWARCSRQGYRSSTKQGKTWDPPCKIGQGHSISRSAEGVITEREYDHSTTNKVIRVMHAVIQVTPDFEWADQYSAVATKAIAELVLDC